MKSINFEFLQEGWPELASLGGFAEQYAQPDPPSALVKLRSFAESTVSYLYQQLDITAASDLEPTLYELLQEESFRKNIPAAVLNKLHAFASTGIRLLTASLQVYSKAYGCCGRLLIWRNGSL